MNVLCFMAPRLTDAPKLWRELEVITYGPSLALANMPTDAR